MGEKVKAKPGIGTGRARKLSNPEGQKFHNILGKGTAKYIFFKILQWISADYT